MLYSLQVVIYIISADSQRSPNIILHYTLKSFGSAIRNWRYKQFASIDMRLIIYACEDFVNFNKCWHIIAPVFDQSMLKIKLSQLYCLLNIISNTFRLYRTERSEAKASQITQRIVKRFKKYNTYSNWIITKVEKLWIDVCVQCDI